MRKSLHFKKQLMKWIVFCGTLLFAAFYFFPVFYMFITGFKTENQAAYPTLIFTPTLETYKEVLNSDMMRYLGNSVFQVVLGTLITTVLSVFAAFSILFARFKKRGRVCSMYYWFITTILLPPVAVLLPLFIIFSNFHLNQNSWSLLFLYVGFHIPIGVWLIYSFFCDIPGEVVEAAQVDGCDGLRLMFRIIVPIARVGIITAALLVAVFIWNEFFLGFNLSSPMTATVPVYLQKFKEQQGQFIAKLCASTTLASLPPIICGWFSLKSLIKGLTSGAVKG